MRFTPALCCQCNLHHLEIGDINEYHPFLLPTVTSIIGAPPIPEMWSWILAPFLFLLGFGPLGPIKGSIAAWAQSFFWGAAVPAGSWFAWLQAAGMTIPWWLAWFIAKIPLLTLPMGVVAWLFRAVFG